MRIADLLESESAGGNDTVFVDGFEMFSSPDGALQWLRTRRNMPATAVIVDGVVTVKAPGMVDLDNSDFGYPALPIMLECDSLFMINNKLTSLHGCPPKLNILNCSENRLVDLKFGPRKVEKFYCEDNQVPLISLDGLPEEAKAINLSMSVWHDHPLSLHKLLFVKGLESVTITNVAKQLDLVEWLLKRRLRLVVGGASPRRAVLEFQQDLIDEGLEQWF